MAKTVAAAPAHPTPINWTNQDLVLYHETIDFHGHSILTSVTVAMGRSRTDFGKGFYTTTDLAQARSWAHRLSRRVPGSAPVVVQLTILRDDLAPLDALWFVRGGANAEDFWSLVKHCRIGGSNHARVSVGKGWYDVVVGPLATTWQQRICLSSCDQISFHTKASEALLNASPRVFVP